MSDTLFSSSDGIDPEVVEAARAELAEKLPELRKLPGFPIGSDEDILKMSVPPYYTACPNPFIEDWLEATKPDGYEDREYVDPGPFASDVSAGKTSLFYKAHSYPTKVPHEVIVRHILHYTQPGDVVLDGFSGTGMTGVAAQVCRMPGQKLKASVEAELGSVDWGTRRAILQDLSPWASFIAAGLNLPIDGEAFRTRAESLLAEFDREWGWMYETTHTDGSKVRIDYTVWSEVFTCPHCGDEVVFYDVAFDKGTGRVRKDFECLSCGSTLTKRSLERRKTSVRTVVGDKIDRIDLRPVRIHYRVDGEKFSKAFDDADKEVLQRIAGVSPDSGVPVEPLPYKHLTHERNPLPPKGFSRMHHLWGDRSLVALSVLWRMANREIDPLTKHGLLFWVEQAIWGMSWMNGYEAIQFGRLGGSQVNRFKLDFIYIPSLISECSPWYNLEGTTPQRGKLANLSRMWNESPAVSGAAMVSTASSTRLLVPDSSVDYIFVDPPFGANKYYSDLGQVVESWYGVLEDAVEEAVVNTKSGPAARSLGEYGGLMAACFKEFFRVLKPGRWMTVEFSNSSTDVWLSIQEGLSRAGYVVADSRVFDKQQGSFRQVTATNVVKRDLIISCYKPSTEVESRFALVAGTPDGAWEFVSEHLSHLPVVEGRRGEGGFVRERFADRLYDRMVAYHVHRSVSVPLTAAEFYSGLEQRFPVRDDMYFLPEQVEEYERHRMTFKELAQLEMFITGEASAVQWLRQLLKKKPRTYAEIHPLFLAELQDGVSDWEELPELRELLEESFLQDGQDRWFVPDPKKSADLEAQRTKGLLREFETYVPGRGKLSSFRSEAVRAGFKDAWGRRDFSTIAAVGERLPADAFVEDEALLYYYDNARRLIPEAN